MTYSLNYYGFWKSAIDGGFDVKMKKQPEIDTKRIIPIISHIRFFGIILYETKAVTNAPIKKISMFRNSINF